MQSITFKGSEFSHMKISFAATLTGTSVSERAIVWTITLLKDNINICMESLYVSFHILHLLRKAWTIFVSNLKTKKYKVSFSRGQAWKMQEKVFEGYGQLWQQELTMEIHKRHCCSHGNECTSQNLPSQLLEFSTERVRSALAEMVLLDTGLRHVGGEDCSATTQAVPVM